MASWREQIQQGIGQELRPQYDRGSWFGSPGSWFGGGPEYPPPRTYGPYNVSPQPFPGQVTDLPPVGTPTPVPSAQPANPSGTSTPWGGTGLPTNNTTPPQVNGSGTQTAWGGPKNPPVVPTSTPASRNADNAKRFSFMNNPGATDALVAFGAAMLKAPDFNSGLGDAALAVNDVAKQYRPITEEDKQRAKDLGMLQRLQSGKTATPNGVDVDQKTSFYGPGNKLYFAATDANGNPGLWDASTQKFVSEGVPGLTRATDSAIGSINRYGAKNDADAEKQGYIEAQSATQNLIRLDELRKNAPTAGVGLDVWTQSMRKLVEYTGESWDKIDPTSVSTIEASSRQLALDWSTKMQGQGQVTDTERKFIIDMLPRSIMDPKAYNNLIDLLSTIERRKQQMALDWYANQDTLRQQYGSYRGYALAQMAELQKQQAQAQAPSSTPSTPSSSSGGSNPALEEALKKYGG